MSQENVQAMRGLYDAFNRGELETLDRGFSSQIVWYEPENSRYAGGNPYRGFEAIRDGVFQPINREFEDFRLELDQLIDAGDTVVTTGRYRGKNRTTGRDLSSQFCHLLHVDGNGKLDRVQQFEDTLHQAQVDGRVERLEEPQIRQPMPA